MYFQFLCQNSCGNAPQDCSDCQRTFRSPIILCTGNAVVNQVASLSYLIAPMLGGVLYAMLGLKPVMYASVVCFFITALFECFIKLSYQRIQNQGGVLQIVKQDFLSSMQYITKEQTSISKMLLLTALSRFFVMGITIVITACIPQNDTTVTPYFIMAFTGKMKTMPAGIMKIPIEASRTDNLCIFKEVSS